MNYTLPKPELMAVFGDWHGDGAWAEKVLNRVGRMGVRNAVQLGDLGLWPGISGVRFLDIVNTACRKWGITLYAVRGNHDWNWWEELLESDFSVVDHQTGGVYVRSHIVLLPRTGEFVFQGKWFFVAGGAVSVDRQFRDSSSWWVEEQLTDAEVDAVRERHYDVLLTHDASDKTPFQGRFKPDLESKIHRQRIDWVLNKTTPKMHFHGHFHTWYDWMNQTGPGNWTQTYGLAMNGMSMSTGILNVKTMKFEVVI